MAAVTEQSGAGKSILASLLLRLHDPAKDRIAVAGHDLRALMLGSLRGKVALVLQETLIFHGTLAENIALGAGREGTRDEIEAPAQLAHLFFNKEHVCGVDARVNAGHGLPQLPSARGPR